jgi:hypothetical protein
MNLETFIELKLSTQVMSIPIDLLITNIILKEHKPSKIYEIGTGNGAWALTHFLSGVIEPKYVLLDNFAWAKAGWVGHKFWPNNEHELSEYLNNVTEHSLNFEVVNSNIYDYIESIDDNSNTIRIDMDLDHAGFSKIVDKLDDRGLLLVDDVVTNNGMNRVVNLIDLKRQGKLYPLWVGLKENAWVKNTVYRDELYEKLCNTIKQFHPKIGLTKYDEPYLNLDQWKYFTTMESDIYKKFKNVENL